MDSNLLTPEDQQQQQQQRDNSATAAIVDVTEYYQPTISETTSLLMRRASAPTSRRESTALRMSYSSIKSRYEQEADSKLIHSSGGVFGVLHGYSITEQLNSGWFILMTLFTTIQMLRINYFVATIKSQELYLYHGNESLATTINHFSI